ncbi:hypothetical protein AFLA70_340g000800 [Aspergillus flavus AF70]|nr:hypothetical protein AFLA70_340g000800 [Aspergillus flavus AF70]
MVYKGVFTATDRVNCLLPINGGGHILIGTYSGVYLIDQRPSKQYRAVANSPNLRRYPIGHFGKASPVYGPIQRNPKYVSA